MMEIIPYKSVGPIAFGMTVAEIHAAIGQPFLTDTSYIGDTVLRYKNLNAVVSAAGLVEVGLLPEMPTFLMGISIFSSPSAFFDLCRRDGAPQECLGFVVLLNLGITMTGFHDGDEAQKAVTVFALGRWDSMAPDMQPLLFT